MLVHRILVHWDAEQVVKGAQHREDARLAAALFLGEAGVAVADRALDAVLGGAPGLGCRQRGKRLGDWRDQHPAALIQRLDREIPAARGEYQRWVDEPHIEPRIAPGELEARRQ